MKKNVFQLAFFSVLIFAIACNGDKFSTSATGLKFKMHTKSEGPKPKVGDIINMEMIYKTEADPKTGKDSVIYSTYDTKHPVVTVLSAPSFKGGIEEGFAMLGKGDSATFIVSADSLFLKTFHAPSLPPFVKAGSMLTFIVKMNKFESQEEMKKAETEAAEKNKNEEQAKIAAYLKQNNITQTPTSNGMYYVETLAGKGSNPDTSCTVFVQYTGKFFDGKVFDSSVNSGKPLDFKLGSHRVIPGWEQGIAMMKKGGKATLILPSSLAYGERGAPNPQTGEYIIPPFTPLVFDVELVDIKK